MIREGAIVVVRSVTTDGRPGKIRPAVIVRRLPGPQNDWLIAMISSRFHQAVDGLDVVLVSTASDFAMTGLKTSSVVRAGRLAVINTRSLLGRIGGVSSSVQRQLKKNISAWILGSLGPSL